MLRETPDWLKPICTQAVKQRSPLSYAGGKSWFVPYIHKWLKGKDPGKITFVEPFAGAAHCSIAVATEDWARKVVFSELDDRVAAVWTVTLGWNCHQLVNRLSEYVIESRDAVVELIKSPALTQVELAFRTILETKVRYGAGLADRGYAIRKTGKGRGKKFDYCWNPKVAKARIESINKRSWKIEFVHGCALETVERFSSDPNAAFFVDPPYTTHKAGAGWQLYRCAKVDHERLFSLLAKAKGDFLMTYDDHESVIDLCERNGFQFMLLPMWNQKAKRMNELLISKNLDWLCKSEFGLMQTKLF